MYLSSSSSSVRLPLPTTVPMLKSRWWELTHLQLSKYMKGVAKNIKISKYMKGVAKNMAYVLFPVTIYVLGQHRCVHTFSSTQKKRKKKNLRRILSSIHPCLILPPHHFDQTSERPQISTDALWRSKDTDLTGVDSRDPCASKKH